MLIYLTGASVLGILDWCCTVDIVLLWCMQEYENNRGAESYKFCLCNNLLTVEDTSVPVDSFSCLHLVCLHYWPHYVTTLCTFELQSFHVLNNILTGLRLTAKFNKYLKLYHFSCIYWKLPYIWNCTISHVCIKSSSIPSFMFFFLPTGIVNDSDFYQFSVN